MSLRKSVYLLAGLVIMIFFSGCDLIEQWTGTGKPDLTVTSVQALASGTTGEITGVRIVIKNAGTADATGVAYNILLTDDTVVSLANDTLIYASAIDLALGEEKQIDITNAQTKAYMAANSTSAPPDGRYYLGATADPNDAVTEKVETNNEGVSSATTWYLGGSPMVYVVQGTITIPSGLTYNNGTLVPASGQSYSLYCFAMPMGFSLPTIGVLTPFSDYAKPGWAKVTFQTFGSQLTVDYTCGIPVSGQYYVCALMDVDGDASFQMDSVGPPIEPWGVWPPTAGAPVFQNITASVTNADLTMSSGAESPK
jgi:hypothetical protein